MGKAEGRCHTGVQSVVESARATVGELFGAVEQRLRRNARLLHFRAHFEHVLLQLPLVLLESLQITDKLNY